MWIDETTFLASSVLDVHEYPRLSLSVHTFFLKSLKENDPYIKINLSTDGIRFCIILVS